jgi:hypothetical protein
VPSKQPLNKRKRVVADEPEEDQFDNDDLD